jgi:putative endonuclease
MLTSWPTHWRTWWRRLVSGHLALGRRGERVAARHLRGRGYRILRRNFRAAGVEADILALAPDAATLVIVEVKTRSGDCIAAEDRIDRSKRFRLARLAAHLQRQPRHAGHAMRFDTIAVVYAPGRVPTVRHIEAAFDSPF